MLNDPSKNRTCDLLFRNNFRLLAGKKACTQNASSDIAFNPTGPRLTHNDGPEKLNGRHVLNMREVLQ